NTGRRSEGGSNQIALVLDGEPWQCGDNGEIIVPAGEHRIGGGARDESFASRPGNGGRGEDNTPGIDSVGHASLAVSIGYSSSRRSWVTVAREPRAVRIDGRAVTPWVHHGVAGWLVELPAGHHVVAIEGATAASAVVDIASVLSSRSIVWLGGRFVLLLGG